MYIIISWAKTRAKNSKNPTISERTSADGGNNFAAGRIEFQEVHVEGARNIPLDRLNPPHLLKEQATSSEPRYFICQKGGCGGQACEKFHRAGFTNVTNVEGGIQACVDAGIPAVRGKKTMSLERQMRIAAGSLVLTGVASGYFVHPALYGLSAFVGAALVFAGITDTCGMGMLLACMPWNQVASPTACASR